jgi:N-methylhydantoinase B
VEKYEFAPDSAGAGRWRGASGIHWEMVNHGGPAGMSTGNAEGETVHGLGALGGLPAPFNQAHLLRNGDTLPLRAHRIYSLSPEDRVVKVTGGGGGVGPPFEREPERVREDVRDGFVTIESAKEIYGVVIDAQTRELDLKATERLRREMKKATAAA